MDSVKVYLENGQEKEVNGIYYIFNSKYYFMYTEKEIDENGYVVLHLAQIGKEVKSTPSGNQETGFLIGLEIADPEEWKLVQGSITKIVDDKRNGTASPEIQYLPINMLSNLKIVSKKTFRLMQSVMLESFKIDVSNTQPLVQQAPLSIEVTDSEEVAQAPVQPVNPFAPVTPVVPEVSETLQESKPEETPVAQPNTESIAPASANPANPIVVPFAPVTPVVPEVSAPLQESKPEEVPIAQPNMESITPASVTPVTPVDPFGDSQVSSATIPSEDSNIIIDYRAKFFEEQEKNKQLQATIDELNSKISNIKNIIG